MFQPSGNVYSVELAARTEVARAERKAMEERMMDMIMD
jgi:hypothetical protein